jgi:hypothetical protein
MRPLGDHMLPGEASAPDRRCSARWHDPVDDGLDDLEPLKTSSGLVGLHVRKRSRGVPKGGGGLPWVGWNR